MWWDIVGMANFGKVVGCWGHGGTFRTWCVSRNMQDLGDQSTWWNCGDSRCLG